MCSIKVLFPAMVLPKTRTEYFDLSDLMFDEKKRLSVLLLFLSISEVRHFFLLGHSRAVLCVRMRAKRKEKDRAKKSRQENALNFFVFHRSLSLTRFSLSADCSFVKSSKTMASIASLHPQLSRYKLSSMVVWLVFIPHIVYFESNPQPQNRRPGQHQY